MPYRQRPSLSQAQRAGLEAELRMLGEQQRRATLDKYVKVSEAYDAGMSLRKIGEIFGVTGNAAFHWKTAGEEERKRRGDLPA